MTDTTITRKKIIKIVLLAVFFAVLLFPARYVNTLAGYFGCFFLAALLVLSVLCMQILKRSITVESDLEDLSCVRGEQTDVGLRIRNASPLSAPKARMVFILSDLFGETALQKELTFAIGTRADQDFGFRVGLEHIGVFRVGMQDLTVYDMWGLFQIRIPIQGTYEVAVRPRIHDMADQIEQEESEQYEESSGAVTSGGMDYAGVREYTPGDPMKQIHWKLSAHTFDYLTKLSESTMRRSYVVLLDFAAPDYESEELMDLNDCLIETALSVIAYLMQKDETYSLIYADRKHRIRRVIPKDVTDASLIRDFDRIYPQRDETYPDAAALILEEGSRSNHSSNLIVCTSKVTDATVQELLHVRSQRRNPELFYIIPERLNSREREAAARPLRAFDEAGIPYHLRTTKENEIQGV